MRTPLALVALVGAIAIPSTSLSAKQQADIIIRNVTIIDVENAKSVPGQSVVVTGDDIAAVGPDKVISKGWKVANATANVVDGKGRYLIPGLWDMHVHFGGGPELIEENKALLPLYVANGITSIRDCSGDLPYDVLKWRGEITNGSLFGPTLYSSGPKIEGLKPVWKGTIETGSQADVDAAVARLKDLKVDFVKITDSTLDPKLFLYAVSKARSEGFQVSGHIPYAETIGSAMQAGISSIEHLDYAFKAGVKNEAQLAADFSAGKLNRAQVQAAIDSGFDPATAEQAYQQMARNNVFVSPTLSISKTIAYLDQDNHQDDPELSYIGPKLRATYQWRVDRAAKATKEDIAARHQHFEQMASILPRLQKEGVTIMAGTDAGFLNSYDYPGFALHDEMNLYVRYGLSPAQALQSAITAGPKWFGKMDRYGDITKGKAADLVLLNRNPLDDIEATRSINSVIMRGKLYRRADLDAMLAKAKAQVADWDKTYRPPNPQ